GIDPQDVIALYGADALRYTLIAGMGLGADVFLDPADLEKTFAPGRNFATKLWNIGRFLLANVGSGEVRPFAEVAPTELTRADAWILERLDAAVREADRALGPVNPGPRGVWLADEQTAGLRLNDFAETARRFVWNELADWYLEAIKTRLQTPGADQQVARSVLVHVFDRALRLLHPIVPYITEALWQRLPGHVDGTFLATASWPEPRADRAADARAGDFELVKDVVEAMRRVRAEYNVPPGKTIEAFCVATPQRRAVLEHEFSLIARLSRTALAFLEGAPETKGASVILPGGTELVVPLEGLIDVKKECARLTSELGSLEKQLASLEGRLANPGFIERAPSQVIEAERAKRTEWSTRRDQLRARIEELCGAG
ncbi:MAG TPA: class I tRNA ligase family protein, partial [Myxococcales bacterium]